MLDKAGRKCINSIECSNHVGSAVRVTNTATVLHTVKVLAALRSENVLVAVYVVNTSEKLRVKKRGNSR